MEKAKMAYATKIDYDTFQKLPFNGWVAQNTHFPILVNSFS